MMDTIILRVKMAGLPAGKQEDRPARRQAGRHVEAMDCITQPIIYTIKGNGVDDKGTMLSNIAHSCQIETALYSNQSCLHPSPHHLTPDWGIQFASLTKDTGASPWFE